MIMNGDQQDTSRLGVPAADRFYSSLANRDGAALLDSLDEDFVLTLSPGLPLPTAREHHGRAAAVSEVWGRIPAGFELRCEPDRAITAGADEVVVLGHYRGDGWEAPFAHLLTTKDGRLASLRQLTDTRCWPDPPAAPHVPDEARS